MRNLSLLIAVIFVISSCSSNKICKYEKDYNNVSDSLAQFIKHDKSGAYKNQELTKDFSKLSCAAFQEKHKLSDNDLRISIQTMRTSISILAAFKAIENNIELAEENKYAKDFLNTIKDDGLSDKERNERDSLIEVVLNGTPEEKVKAKKELKKFQSEYSFNRKLKTAGEGEDDDVEVKVVMKAFE